MIKNISVKEIAIICGGDNKKPVFNSNQETVAQVDSYNDYLFGAACALGTAIILMSGVCFIKYKRKLSSAKLDSRKED
jgi:hypothetical protein